MRWRGGREENEETPKNYDRDQIECPKSYELVKFYSNSAQDSTLIHLRSVHVVSVLRVRFPPFSPRPPHLHHHCHDRDQSSTPT